ncbi:MAG: 5-oxoprolinase, partial [Rhodospirillales bacterium]|nr:5-oxoprolinase [Rhodospirillales bacterium]
ALAIISIATENMVQAIVDITVNQGIDPRKAVLIGGGGAAGLNSIAIARRLGCSRAIIPEVGAALSAAGAMMSDLSSQYRRTHFMTSDEFDMDSVNELFNDMEMSCNNFIAGPGEGAIESSIEFFAEARYPEQVWEIEVPIKSHRFESRNDVESLVEAFHAAHQDIFAINDPDSGIEVVGWTANVKCRLKTSESGVLVAGNSETLNLTNRKAYFSQLGFVDVSVRRFETMNVDEEIKGPAIIESAFTTVVIDPGAIVTRRESGSLSINPGAI